MQKAHTRPCCRRPIDDRSRPRLMVVCQRLSWARYGGRTAMEMQRRGEGTDVYFCRSWQRCCMVSTNPVYQTLRLWSARTGRLHAKGGPADVMWCDVMELMEAAFDADSHRSPRAEFDWLIPPTPPHLCDAQDRAVTVEMGLWIYICAWFVCL